MKTKSKRKNIVRSKRRYNRKTSKKIRKKTRRRNYQSLKGGSEAAKEAAANRQKNSGEGVAAALSGEWFKEMSSPPPARSMSRPAKNVSPSQKRFQPAPTKITFQPMMSDETMREEKQKEEKFLAEKEHAICIYLLSNYIEEYEEDLSPLSDPMKLITYGDILETIYITQLARALDGSLHDILSATTMNELKEALIGAFGLDSVWADRTLYGKYLDLNERMKMILFDVIRGRWGGENEMGDANVIDPTYYEKYQFLEDMLLEEYWDPSKGRVVELSEREHPDTGQRRDALFRKIKVDSGPGSNSDTETDTSNTGTGTDSETDTSDTGTGTDSETGTEPEQEPSTKQKSKRTDDPLANKWQAVTQSSDNPRSMKTKGPEKPKGRVKTKDRVKPKGQGKPEIKDRGKPEIKGQGKPKTKGPKKTKTPERVDTSLLTGLPVRWGNLYKAVAEEVKDEKDEEDLITAKMVQSGEW